MLGPIAQSSGFWGPVTSTVDWCEANYQVTPYVAELWNTLSSLALVGAGLFGALGRHARDGRVRAAFGLLAVVGMGSIAFHASLRFELQILDELPMLYLVTLIVFILAEPGPPRRFGPWFPIVLVAADAVLTLLSAGSRGPAQFWIFQVAFGSLEFWSLGRTAVLYWRSKSVERRRLFRFGMTAYLAGIAVWFVDLRFCAPLVTWLTAHGLPNPQFHAWWHVLVAGGFYALLTFIAREQRASVP